MTCTNLRRGRDLDGCSFTVPVGVRLLLVSDPPASSSTLVRVLAGLAPFGGGRVWVAGSELSSVDGVPRRLAYLGPDAGLHEWMTPTEALQLSGDLLGLPRYETVRRMRRAIAWARISPSAATRPMRRGGEPLLQRTGLAAVLMAEPEVVLLDDPLRAIELEERTRLLSLTGQRRTVILASTDPAIEAGLADTVAYLEAGRISMLAPLVELERAGLPLSHRGIADLSRLMEALPPDQRAAAG
ncbi:MAG: ATP-binding cassette domain-containing protein [Candidatus Limnocylindria bacterium]